MLNEALAPFYSETIAPFAVALSGGGDSMALLHALKGAPQLYSALIVDHGLRFESAKEARLTKSRAEAMGVSAHILTWEPGPLKSGLQEKARKARYHLMGAFCRRHGLSTLLTAHHLGDQAETLVMRYDKGTDWRGAGGMSHEVYAPLWPELSSVTLCRPLLSVPKKEILSYLRHQKLDWVEDPSNQNRTFTRVRIRQKLSEEPPYLKPVLQTARELRQAKSDERKILAKQAEAILRLDKNGFAELSDIPYPELLSALLRIVSGTGGPIENVQIRHALKEMRRPDFKALTLAGAQISKTDKGFLLCRDAVAVKGRGNKNQTTYVDQTLPVREPYIWDGRFLAKARINNISVAPLYGQISTLPKNLSHEIKQYPAPVRISLPIWRNGPHILGVGEGEFEGLSVRCFAGERLEATLGETNPIFNRTV